VPRPPALPAQDKARLVLAVLSKETTVSQAARQARVSEQAIANWRRQFIQAGSLGLDGQAVGRLSQKEEVLSDEVRKLKQALGEAYVELLAWRKVGEVRRVPSPTSS
jgi:transposase